MHKITLREAVAEICRWSIWIDTEGKIHTTGNEQPPREVTDRLEEAGFGSGGEEWRQYVHEMLHPDEADQCTAQTEAPSVEDAVLAKLSRFWVRADEL